MDEDHLLSGDGPVRLSGCLSVPPEYTSCFDDVGHGSHVAGIAAARDNGEGYIGIMKYPGILGLPVGSAKVCGPDFSVGLITCVMSAVLGGLDWTVTNGRTRQIVNMTWGGENYSTALATAIAASYSAGNLLVSTAGNDLLNNNPSVHYPGALSQVIAVSGTLPDDSFADWILCPMELRTPVHGGSVFGSDVELSAPFWAKSMWENGQYEVDCGTSMAAPVVSGIAALAWTQHPSWTSGQVRNHLQETALDLGAGGRDPYFGYGRVDALRAPRPKVTINGPNIVLQGEFAQWSASVSDGKSPYTYTWFENGSPVGTGSSYGTFVGFSDFALSVTVTDDPGNSDSAGKFINVTSCPPPQRECE